jgi:hypothetical protein
MDYQRYSYDRRQAAAITKHDVERWKADLRRMTKIYRSIPAAKEEDRLDLFREARQLFNGFRKNFEDWVYRHLLPTNKKEGKGWLEEQVRTKAWDAAISLGGLFPSVWDYKTDTHQDSPSKLAQDIEKNVRRYQKEFTEAFKVIEEYIEDQERKGPLERRDAIEKHSIAGMNVVVYNFGRDDDNGAYEEDLDDFMRKLDGFAKRIERAGFGDALKGMTVSVQFADPEKLGRPTGLTAGQYNAATDTMQVFPLGFIKSDGGTFTHEVGHRFWFRNLTPQARARWEEVFTERTHVIDADDVNEYVNTFLVKHTDLWSTKDLVRAVDEEDPIKEAKFKALAFWSRPMGLRNDDIAGLREALLRLGVGEKVHIEAISEYATTSPTEAFAEAFRFYILQGPGVLGPWTRWFFREIMRSGGAKIAAMSPLTRPGVQEYDVRCESLTVSLVVDVQDDGQASATVEVDRDSVSRGLLEESEEDILRGVGRLLGVRVAWGEGDWGQNRLHNTWSRGLALPARRR